MDFTQAIVILFGLIASASFITANYVIKRKWIIILQGLGSLGISSMFAVRALTEGIPTFWGIVVLNIILLGRNIYLYLRENYLTSQGLPIANMNTKAGVIVGVLVISIYFVVTPLPHGADINTLSLAFFILPLVAFLANVTALAQNQLVPLKWFILMSVTSWVVFDILAGAWPILIGDAFSAVATSIALWRLRSAKG